MGALLTYENDGSNVVDDSGVDDEDYDYNNRNDDYVGDNDNGEEEEEATAVRNNKHRHGTMEEEGGGGEEEDKVIWLSMKSRSKMSDGELCTHFNTQLQKKGSSICPNRQCNCLALLHNGNARSSIVRYMTWFSRQTQYKQNSIVLQWIRYSTLLRTQGQSRTNYFWLPYIDDGTEDVPDTVRNHVLCTRGLRFIFRFGRTRYQQIWSVLLNLAIFPLHKAVGKTNYNAIENDTRKYEPLVRHFDYLMNLGEVQATRLISTFINGMVSHENCNASLDVTYLPISMGYRSCYRRYMSSLGYIVDTTATGGFKIRKEDGSAVDTGEFVSFPTYHTKWKRDYPNLKVSRPVEDICNLCYTFVHRNKFFTDHMMRCGGYDDTDNNDHEDDNNEDQDVVDELARLTRDININRPECASDKVAEEREQMMLKAAEHIKMARAQRQLYQEKVEKARRTVEKVHLERTYTFVVDYGQNMELPIFNSEQPGATYYYSPMTVNNLGMVDHAHIYPDGTVGEHMHCHVYTDAVGKKGANNVVTLIMKTLRRLNLLCNDEQGSELNIVFDNCCGQNKNNTVLRLPAWIAQLGYFLEINFIFLVVGHTKNAVDRLFNSLKVMYRKKSLYTFGQLVDALGTLRTITVHPTVSEDFLDYGKLFDFFYKKLTGKIKQNHIFSTSQGDEIRVRERVLAKHEELIWPIMKKDFKDRHYQEIVDAAETKLRTLEWERINPYKVYELFKNFRPYVPVEFQSDEMYAEPSPEVLAKVKAEKADRKEFWVTLKKKKYDRMKEQLKKVVFSDDDDEADGAAM